MKGLSFRRLFRRFRTGAGRRLLRAGPAAAALLAAAACAGACSTRKSGGAAYKAPEFTAASGRSALERIGRFLEISPRDPGTAGGAYAAQWIAQELKRIGLRPVADTWTETCPAGPVQYSNVYAELPGTEDTLVIIGTHFDTKTGAGPGFQGANDGGSSVGVALELAALLKNSPAPRRHTLRFAFLDGEECIQSYQPNDGLAGSRRMAARLAASRPRNKVAVIILDMIGDSDLKITIPRNVTPWIATVALDASDHAGYGKMRIGEMPIVDDHWPFVRAGFSAIDLIDFDYGSAPGKNDYWHTEHDTFDKLSAESLTTTGRIVMDMVEQLENGAGDTAGIDGPDKKK